MIQIGADLKDGYLINADEEAMRVLRDGMDYALEHGLWEGMTLGQHGAMPISIKVSDEPEPVA